MLLIAVAAVLFVLAIAVVIFSIGQRNALRGVFTSICLLAASGVTAWVSQGGEIAFSRNYVVITADDVPPNNLKVVLSAIPKHSYVSFVVLGKNLAEGDEKQAPPERNVWIPIEHFERNDKIIDRVLKDPNNLVDLAKENWAENLVDRGIVFLHDAPGFFSRGTLLVVAVDTETTRRADVRQIPTEKIVQILSSEDQLELYQVRVEHENSLGVLKLIPNSLVIPSNNIADLGGNQIRVELHHCSERLDLSELKLKATLSGPAKLASDDFEVRRFKDRDSATLGGNSFERDKFDSDICATKFRLSELFLNDQSADLGAESSPKNNRLDSGLHLLEVELKTGPVDGGFPGPSYHASTYLLAETSSVLILAPGYTTTGGTLKGFGSLSQPGWSEWEFITGKPVPENLKRLLESFFARKRWVQGSRTPDIDREIGSLPESRLGVKKEPIPADDATGAGNVDRESGAEEVKRLIKVLDGVRTLFLVEPTAVQLAYLDALLSLDTRIREGLNVVVVGPPRIPTDSLPWLPSHPVPAAEGSSRLKRVHAEDGMYLLLDHSRVMRFTPPNATNTGLELQYEFATKLGEELGFAEAVVSKQDDKPNHTRRVFSSSGRLLTSLFRQEDGENSRRLRLFPPFTIESSDRDPLLRGSDDVGAGSPTGYEREVAEGSIKLRLNSLFVDPGANFSSPQYRPLIKGDLYPNTHVVLIVSDLSQLDKLRRMKFQIGDKQATELALPENLVGIDDLLKMGLHIHPVVIPQKTWLPAYEKFLSDAGQDTAQIIQKRSLSAGFSGDMDDRIEVLDLDNARSAAKELAERLRNHDSGGIKIQDYARVFDVRIKPSGSAPDTHLILQRRGGDEVPGTQLPMSAYAVYMMPDGKEPTRFGLVDGQPYGEGQVTVLSYSPFSEDVWDADAGRAAWNGWNGGRDGELVPKNEARYQGMGVQRLIDAYGLAGAVRPFPLTRLIPSRFELDADGAGLQIEFWGRLRELAASKPVVICAKPGERENKEEIPLNLASFDVGDGRAAFQLRAPYAMMGICILKYGSTPHESLPMYVALQEPKGQGTTIWEAFRLIGEYTGGGEVSTTPEEFPKVYQQTVTWVAALAITLVIIAVFSPFARPWTNFFKFLRRNSGRHGIALAGRYRLDVEAFMVEWGATLGRTQSGKIAGIPGGEKFYESGDSLASARPESLFPFVSGELRLPQRAPIVRLTHITHSLNAVILVGNGVGLRVPGESRYVSKLEAVKFACGIIASVVWQHGGMLRAGSLYSGTTEFGPVSSGNADALARYIEALVAAPARVPEELPLPSEVDDGATVFVISDFLQTPIDNVVGFVERASARDMSCRFLKVFDPDECRLLGLGKLPGSWAMLDRSQISERELEVAYREYSEVLRRSLEDVDARMVMLDTSEDAAELARKFRDAGFFD